jgi:hypothetical protein
MIVKPSNKPGRTGPSLWYFETPQVFCLLDTIAKVKDVSASPQHAMEAKAQPKGLHKMASIKPGMQ